MFYLDVVKTRSGCSTCVQDIGARQGWGATKMGTECGGGRSTVEDGSAAAASMTRALRSVAWGHTRSLESFFAVGFHWTSGITGWELRLDAS